MNIKPIFRLHAMNATELATLETLLRRLDQERLADMVAEEGTANAGDEYADYQGFANEYFRDNE